MPVVRRIRNRGATITVEANAEVMFADGGQVNDWTNRFTGRIRAATIAAAPTNKRPRWGHYGKPLKSTIVSARPRFWSNGGDKQRVYGAVGSKSAHGYYVDQGTGVYAGNGPYRAKVLPPWTRGSASLYEHTWRPGGPDTGLVAPVMIKGQKGQHFFDKGLGAAFRSMRLRSAQVAGEPSIGRVLDSVATGLDGFLGNTPDSPGFRASLEEWRAWRDAAWHRNEGLGRGGGIGSRMHKAHMMKMAAARRAKQTKNLAKLHASQAAAERRRKAQVKALAKVQAAKALGKKRAAEQQAKFENEQAKRQTRARAVAFAKGKKEVSGTFYRDADTGLATFFRVTWTTKSGKRKTRDFKV